MLCVHLIRRNGEGGGYGAPIAHLRPTNLRPIWLKRPEGADASAREKGRALRDCSAKMGADQSMLSKDEIHLVAHFSERDIRRLYGRFRSLDSDGNGQLDPSLDLHACIAGLLHDQDCFRAVCKLTHWEEFSNKQQKEHCISSRSHSGGEQDWPTSQSCSSAEV